MEPFWDAIEHFLQPLLEADPWVAYSILFIVCLAEAVPILGYLSPGPSLLLFGGILAAQGRISFSGAVMAGAIGGTVGDYAAYVMGQRWFRPLIVRFRATQMGHTLTEERQAAMEDWVRRWGGWAVFFGRFQQIPRNFVPFLAGMARMPAAPFAAANFSSSLFLSLLWVGTGYLAATVLPQAQDLLAVGTVLFAILSVFLALLYYFVCLRWKLLRAATLSKALVVVASIGLVATYLYALRTGVLEAEWNLSPEYRWLRWVLATVIAISSLAMVAAWIRARQAGGIHILRAVLIGAGSILVLAAAQWFIDRGAPGAIDDLSLSTGPASAAIALAVVLAWWPHLRPTWRYIGLGVTIGAGVVAWASGAAWPSDIAVGWLLVGGWAACVGLAVRLYESRKERRTRQALASEASPKGPV